LQLETKHYYDDETLEFVASRFFIDGEEVKFEDYQYFIKGLEEQNNKYEELVDDSPYTYDEYEECSDECDKCKYKDKKKYEICDNDCKYMNIDKCCNDFCDCENEYCDEREECEGCGDDEFDYGDLLEIYTKRIQETEGCPECIKEILDEFADIFIPDYDEDEFEIEDECDGMIEESDCNKEEFTDQQIEEIKMIETFAYRIENVDCDCGCEMRNLLYELFSIGKNVGWNDHKCFMKELMEEALEE